MNIHLDEHQLLSIEYAKLHLDEKGSVIVQDVEGVVYTQSPLQDSRLLGPRPWNILATTYETNGFLSNPDPGENLVMENLVMETGCSEAT